MGLASMICAIALLPFGAFPALAPFAGDFVMVAYLLALARFFTVLAALDTGSSFEAMGASREVTFSALAEPALFLGLAALARQTGSLSLTSMLGSVSGAMWMQAAPALGLTIAGLGIVFLAENARIPVDDPTTHLELTMIHEVMVLDHGGPDFAMIQYAAALKMWLLGGGYSRDRSPVAFREYCPRRRLRDRRDVRAGSRDRAYRIFDGASATASHHATVDRGDRVVRSGTGAGSR